MNDIKNCKRLQGIDALKVISAFLVVFYHFKHLDFSVDNTANYLPSINYSNFPHQ